jgi:hypothetical protein
MLNVKRRLQVLHGRRFQAHPVWRERLAALGIADDLEWLTLNRGELVSGSNVTRCFRIRLSDGETLYFKRYVYPLRKLLEFWLRPSKAAVEAFGFAQLSRIGIPTLDTLALGELRFLGMLRAACVVTRGIPESQGLDRFAREVWFPMKEPGRTRVCREISDRLAEQLRRAHAARFFHHDLKWRNILIQSDGEGSYTPIWIDCPRADIHRLRWRRGITVDLSGLGRLALSYCNQYGRYRFLRSYLGTQATRQEVKRLYHRVRAHQARRPVTLLQLPGRE